VLIDKTHKRWALFTAVASGASLGIYALHETALAATGKTPSGGSITGLVYGGLALALILFCTLLGLRKALRIWRLGKAQTWMRAHIWLGLLTVPLVFCHSGMKFGNNLTLVISILFVVVIVSGVLGLILQNVIPAIMLDRVPAEATFEQIPHVFEILRTEADELITATCGSLEETKVVPNPPQPKRVTVMIKKDGPVQGKAPAREREKPGQPLSGAEPLKSFYLREVRPFLASGSLRGSKLANTQNATAMFEYTRSLCPAPVHTAIRDLESICEERRQLAVQLRLHALLHGWLFVHAPLSYLLLLLVIVHAIIAPLRY